MSTPELILGTVQLGQNYGINNSTGKPDREVAFKILDYAYEHGISILDTASAYGDSEEIIGEFHKKYGKLFRVCTKLPVKDINGDGIKKEVENASKRLNLIKLYLIYIHRFEQLNDKDIVEKLVDLKNAGYVENIGISIYEPEELSIIIDKYSDCFDVVQIPFNILDNSRWVDEIKKAKDCNLKIYTRSVFLQGLLFKNIEDEVVKKLGSEKYIKAVSDIATEKKVTIQKLLLDYNKGQNIDGILVGCETVEQLADSIKLYSDKSCILEEDYKLIKIITEDISNRIIDPREW